MFSHGGILLREEKHFHAETVSPSHLKLKIHRNPSSTWTTPFLLLTTHLPSPEIQEIDKNHGQEHDSGRVFESDHADFESKVILGGNESAQRVGSSTSSQRPNFELIQYTTFLTEPVNGPSTQHNFGMSEILLKSTEIVIKIL